MRGPLFSGLRCFTTKKNKKRDPKEARMIRHPLRILITVFALYTFLPFLAGIHFHGSIVEALGIAAGVTLVCSALYWLLDALEGASSRRLAHAQVSDLIRLAVLVGSWLVTYVFVPGLVLKLASHVL